MATTGALTAAHLLVTLAAEGGSASGLPAWLVGGGALAILLTLMAVLLAFGKGREHC